jgi:serine/threonine protein kinase
MSFKENLYYLILKEGEDFYKNIFLDLLKRNNISSKTRDQFICEMLKQLSVRLYELHQIKITHNDINPGNVLVFKTDETVKLGY